MMRIPVLPLHYINDLTQIDKEEIFSKIRNNTNYEGTGSLTLGGQGCSFTVINTGGSTREVQAVSTINIFTRKVKVIVSEISPKIIISSWEEVSDF